MDGDNLVINLGSDGPPTLQPRRNPPTTGTMLLLAGFTILVPTLVAARSPYDVPKSQWDALNSTVGGRLGRGVPLSRPCFSLVDTNVTGVQSEATCETVQAGYNTAAFRVSNFGQGVEPHWETCQKTNEGCLLDPSSPTNASAYSPPNVCHQGSVSPYYIKVQNADDVKAGYAFSKRTGVPLAVKNTGHDYAGRSLAPDTLSLWTFNLKHINYTASFVPEGCNKKGFPAMTYGAGQSTQSLYDFAEANNITFIGGSGRTVGAAGGWVQGGGHSIFTNQFGLGVDRVRQFRVVTPDGKLRVANACQNSDLFWALRGGGGGTFGVVLEVSAEVIPNPVATVSLLWDLKPTPANALKLWTIVVENSERWALEGWGGYLYGTTSIIANPFMNATAAAVSLKPLTDFLSSATDGAGGGAGSGATVTWNEFKSFSPLFEAINSIYVPIGFNLIVASRLIPTSLLSPATQSQLLDSIMQSYNRSDGNFALYLTTPYLYNSTGADTSVTPAWRDSIWHALVLTDWPYNGGVSAAQAAYSKMSTAIAPLRSLAPHSGAYQNEADVYEPDWSTSFWGPNYHRLLKIKQKYDPESLLDCWHCVGWKGNDTTIASCHI